MSRRDPHPALAPQPTCRQRPSSTTTGPNSSALEISHAHRLRQKLEQAARSRWCRPSAASAGGSPNDQHPRGSRSPCGRREGVIPAGAVAPSCGWSRDGRRVSQAATAGRISPLATGCRPVHRMITAVSILANTYRPTRPRTPTMTRLLTLVESDGAVHLLPTRLGKTLHRPPTNSTAARPRPARTRQPPHWIGIQGAEVDLPVVAPPTGFARRAPAPRLVERPPTARQIGATAGRPSRQRGRIRGVLPQPLREQHSHRRRRWRCRDCSNAAAPSRPLQVDVRHEVARCE